MTNSEHAEKDSIDRLVAIASYALPVLSGTFLATMDVTTTGHPYFTVGVAAYEEVKRLEARGALKDFKCDIEPPSHKTRALQYLAYSAGASIPFAIVHRAEIFDAAMKFLEYVK